MFVAPSGTPNPTGRRGRPSSDLSTIFVAPALQTGPLSTGFPRSSRPARRSSFGRTRVRSRDRHKNAQRNLATVASATDASTCDVTFDLVAPSGTTYCTGPARPCLPHLSTSFALRGPNFEGLSTAHPRSGARGGSVVLLERPRRARLDHGQAAGVHLERVPATEPPAPLVDALDPDRADLQPQGERDPGGRL